MTIGETTTKIWRFFAILDLLCVHLNKSQRAFGGLNCWNRLSSSEDVRVSMLCKFGLKMPTHALLQEVTEEKDGGKMDTSCTFILPGMQ